MRFTSLVTFTLALAFSAVSSFALSSAGLVVTPWQAGKSRPLFTGAITAGTTIGQNDTLMIAATDSTRTSNRYGGLDPASFWTQVPVGAQYVVSNKDSVVLFVTAARVDADTGDVTVGYQVQAYGTSWITLSTANMPTNVASTRTRFAFPNPGPMKFRFRLTGATATDTTRVYRAEIYDK